MNCPICFKGMTEHQFLTVSQYYCDTKGCMHCTYPLELTHEERLDKLYPAALPSDWPKPLTHRMISTSLFLGFLWIAFTPFLYDKITNR